VRPLRVPLGRARHLDRGCRTCCARCAGPAWGCDTVRGCDAAGWSPFARAPCGRSPNVSVRRRPAGTHDARTAISPGWPRTSGVGFPSGTPVASGTDW